MTNFEEYKTKLIEEIKDLPDGSRILVLASCPGGDADETDNVEYATALHGSLEDMMRLMSNGLEETLVSCQLTPTEGAMFCSILLHELKLAGSRAGMRVLRSLPEEEQVEELEIMLKETLKEMPYPDPDGDGHTEE